MITPLLLATVVLTADARPNVVLVMADDQGWGQAGFMGHPFLETPNIDSMAENGLSFTRFYAGGPTCSPTRASVMTGRTPFRTGVLEHGYALHRQERTLPQILKEAGYATSHFGKWHLNGYRGPGAPILKDDDHSPGEFGFDHWLSVTNFFDMNPLMSRMGKFEQHSGDSSEVIVDNAIKHISQHVRENSSQPFFSVIWYGSPHSPFMASDFDAEKFPNQSNEARKHYGELVAMDRSIGALRKGLRDLAVADNTLVWYCSDNGGLPNFAPESVGGLRGAKGQVFEGGIRVPCVIEWPGHLSPRKDNVPAGVVDILPTVMSVAGLDTASLPHPIDGIDLTGRFHDDTGPRPQPLGFFTTSDRAAWVDGDWKLVRPKKNKKNPAEGLYNLKADPNETQNLLEREPARAAKMRSELDAWIAKVQSSLNGKDYASGSVDANEPPPRWWPDVPEYAPYIEEWKLRPEFKSYIERRRKAKK